MTEPELLPISLVAHTVFCPRRTWLEAVGETVASVAIEHGVAEHDRVDRRQGERALVGRSVALEYPGLGLTGKCDVVDGWAGNLKVVDFKSAPLRRGHEVTPAQRIQLALQRLCLEAAGEVVEGQAVYFATARRTVDIELTDADLEEAADYLRQTREIVTAERAPEPLIDDPRCTRCSHASVCLPDERRGIAVRRRILVPDPGSDVLHVTVPGARVSLKKGRLLVSTFENELASLPVKRPQALVLHGNVDVSSAVVREFMWTGRPVLWASGRGQVIGYARMSLVGHGLGSSSLWSGGKSPRKRLRTCRSASGYHGRSGRLFGACPSLRPHHRQDARTEL